MIFTPMSHLHQPAPLATEEGLKWSYTRVGTSSHSAPVFPLQSSVWWRDCSPAKELRNREFRPVKAALMLSGMCHPFLEESGVQQGSGAPDTASLALPWCCALGKGWQKKDAKIWLCWGPAEQTPGFCLACLGTASAKLVLHSRSQSFRDKRASAAPLGTADFKWVCLPLWAMWTCTAWVHITYGEWRSRELLALLYSQHEFCPLPALAPAGCRAHTLAPCTGSILQAELCFCPRTNCRQLLLRWQAGYKRGTCTSLKGQVIPSTFPCPCLSVPELCRVGLSESWDWTMLSSISLGSNACRMYHPSETLVLGNDFPWMAALWNLSVSQHLHISGC